MSSTVKLNLGEFTALRRDARTLGAINAEADAMAARANSRARGECNHPEHARFKALHAIPTTPGSIALVVADSNGSGDEGAGCYRHNAKHNTLVNAMGGG